MFLHAWIVRSHECNIQLMQLLMVSINIVNNHFQFKEKEDYFSSHIFKRTVVLPLILIGITVDITLTLDITNITNQLREGKQLPWYKLDSGYLWTWAWLRFSLFITFSCRAVLIHRGFINEMFCSLGCINQTHTHTQIHNKETSTNRISKLVTYETWFVLHLNLNSSQKTMHLNL